MIVIAKSHSANRPDRLESPVATLADPFAGGASAAERRTVLEPHRSGIKPLRRAPISLAKRRITAGEAFLQPAGSRTLSYRFAKRAIDLAGSLFLIAALAPVMAAILVVLLFTTRGRPLFFQKRLGWRGKPFWMAKFRTMVLDAEKKQRAVANEQAGPVFKNRRDPRVTAVGRLLRSTSLDETPQLFNVLLGQMSLVGPRPPIAREVADYDPWQRQRLSVKPGLTCLWQVSGRCEIAFLDWVRMDLWYVRNQSLRTDLWLLLKTPLAVLARRGAY